MDAWGKSANAEHLMMLADGNATFTEALGLVLDGTGFGMGTRSQRFAMIVDDGVVSLLNVDAGALGRLQCRSYFSGTVRVFQSSCSKGSDFSSLFYCRSN